MRKTVQHILDVAQTGPDSELGYRRLATCEVCHQQLPRRTNDRDETKNSSLPLFSSVVFFAVTLKALKILARGKRVSERRPG